MLLLDQKEAHQLSVTAQKLYILQCCSLQGPWACAAKHEQSEGKAPPYRRPIASELWKPISDRDL